MFGIVRPDVHGISCIHVAQGQGLQGDEVQT